MSSSPRVNVPSNAAVLAAVVAIDGPAGAGKSTAARTLAGRLGFVLLDTGAIYRGLAAVARREGIRWDDEEALSRRARALRVGFVESDDGQRVLIDGLDVTVEIRTPEISDGA